MLLIPALHLHEKRLSVLSPAQHVENCLPVVLHDSQLLRRNISDVRYCVLRQNHLEEFDENVLVDFRPENVAKCPETGGWFQKIFMIFKFK